MNLLRFSIVIPNYNSGATLERTIKSLLAQEYPNLQLIIVDAVSTDNSHEIVERYRPIFSHVIIEKDRGNGDAINKGFRLADGEIWGWLASDDELTPGTLHHVAELFMQHPEAEVVNGACLRKLPDGTETITPPDPDPWSKIHMHNCIEQPSTFWRASLHRKIGELDLSIRDAFDWEFWCRMREVNAKVIKTPRVLSVYYFSLTNKSSVGGNRFADEAYRIIHRHGPPGIARAYRFLYRHFDLKGCFDKPRTCGVLRYGMMVATALTFYVIFGKRRVYLYNWHFASCQARGMKWWT